MTASGCGPGSSRPKAIPRASSTCWTASGCSVAMAATSRGGKAFPRLGSTDVWLVVRTDTLDWPDGAAEQLASRADAWAEAGSRMVGIQVDFDARTRHLDRYAAFLADLRRRLPPRYRLSITGLMDWSRQRRPARRSAGSRGSSTKSSSRPIRAAPRSRGSSAILSGCAASQSRSRSGWSSGGNGSSPPR